MAQAFTAWEKRRDSDPEGKKYKNYVLPGLGEYTKEQLFFIACVLLFPLLSFLFDIRLTSSVHSFAQGWAKATTPSEALKRIRTDPHSVRLPSLSISFSTSLSSLRFLRLTLLLLPTPVSQPTQYRVIGPLSNNAEFAKAFNCPVGSPLNRGEEKRCEVRLLSFSLFSLFAVTTGCIDDVVSLRSGKEATDGREGKRGKPRKKRRRTRASKAEIGRTEKSNRFVCT